MQGHQVRLLRCTRASKWSTTSLQSPVPYSHYSNSIINILKSPRWRGCWDTFSYLFFHTFVFSLERLWHWSPSCCVSLGAVSFNSSGGYSTWFCSYNPSHWPVLLLTWAFKWVLTRKKKKKVTKAEKKKKDKKRNKVRQWQIHNYLEWLKKIKTVKQKFMFFCVEHSPVNVQFRCNSFLWLGNQLVLFFFFFPSLSFQHFPGE